MSVRYCVCDLCPCDGERAADTGGEGERARVVLRETLSGVACDRDLSPLCLMMVRSVRQRATKKRRDEYDVRALGNMCVRVRC